MTSIAISKDGRRAISGSFDANLTLWDLESGSPIATLKGHTAPVFSVALSPDGSHAFSASQDQTVKQWNLKELSEQAHENAHDEPAPSS